MSAAQRALQPAWPDQVQSSQAIDRAIRQLVRVRETLSRMRALGTKLRDRRQGQRERDRLGHGKLDERSLERMATLENIQLFKRLLEQDGSGKLDPRTTQVMSQLLIEETTRLAALIGDKPRRDIRTGRHHRLDAACRTA